MVNAVVTGANGFVGSAVVKELASHGYKVYAIVRNDRANRLFGIENVRIISCDLSDAGDLPSLIEEKCDMFFHFAWTGVFGAEKTDIRVQLGNAQRAVDCVRVAKRLGCKRFVFAGSIAEKECHAATYTAGNRPGLGYVYGAGKIAAHILCSSVAVAEKIDFLSGEITNTYGAGEDSSRLINSTIRKCIAGISPEFTAGTQRYDFVYIDDVARAFRLIGEKGKPFTNYVIGSSQSKPLKQFLLELKAIVAPDLPFKFGAIPFTGVDLPPEDFDCSRTEMDTGFRAKISFVDGCQMTYEWWKAKE